MQGLQTPESGAVCCSVLQCVAVCCTCVAVFCNVLQREDVVMQGLQTLENKRRNSNTLVHFVEDELRQRTRET